MDVVGHHHKGENIYLALVAQVFERANDDILKPVFRQEALPPINGGRLKVDFVCFSVRFPSVFEYIVHDVCVIKGIACWFVETP
jgi:hypothetical protein